MSESNKPPYLKRYDIMPDEVGTMKEDPEGAWVRYNDVWTLDNNIFVALNDNSVINRRIRHLERIIELYQDEGEEDKGVTKDIGEDDG